MAKRRHRGVELFEVLSEQERAPKSPADETIRPAADETGPLPPHKARTGREVIFSVESAFVIFVAILVLLGSAYKMGHGVGLREARHTLAPDGEPVPLRNNAETAKLVPYNRGEEVLDVPGEMYTLKVFDSKEGLDLLLLDREYLLQQPDINALAIREAYIFKSETEEVHSLGLGLFKARNDPSLVKLMQVVKKLNGPPTRDKMPYAACAICQTQQLGQAVR